MSKKRNYAAFLAIIPIVRLHLHLHLPLFPPFRMRFSIYCLCFLLAIFFDSMLCRAQVLCHTDAYYEQNSTINPVLLSQETDMNLELEEKTKKLWQKRQNTQFAKDDIADYPLVRIPVVVHLVYGNGESVGMGANLSDDRVRAAIDWLNDAYRNRNLYDPASGADTRLEFCLATRDPNGNYSSGITRSLSAPWTNLIQSTEDTPLKQTIGWDRNNYLNIWVVNSIRESASMPPNIAGYSSMPLQAGDTYDGVVVIKDYFGSDYVSNKVLVHEIGHYLGLYHTFRDGCTNNTCLGQGDFVCDTPPDALSSPTVTCSPINSCSTDGQDSSPNNPFRAVALGGKGDQSDLIENYMDYSGYICHTHFTVGQIDRMRLVVSLYRPQLVESGGCQSPFSNDIGISALVQPAAFGCNNTLVVRLQNFGTNTIWSATINYQIDNGISNLQTWNGNLTPGAAVDVLLNSSSNFSQAAHTFSGYTSQPNGTNDTNSDNNALTQRFYSLNSQNIPLNDNFETTEISDTWLLVNSDNATSWQKTWTSACWVNGSGGVYMNHKNYAELGQKDYLIMRTNLDDYANADLTFDLAYARSNSSSSDKLRVAVSTDCGSSFEEVYYKSGSQLATVSNLVANDFSPNSCTQWRTESINLIKFAGQDIIIAFEAINFNNNNLHLDNVRLNGTIDIACHPPTNFIVLNSGISSASLSWQNYENEAESYHLRYRIAGTTAWTEIYNVQAPYTLNNLMSNTTYEVAVMSDCAGALFSDYTNPLTLSTIYDPCPPPINLTVADIDKNFALLTWTAPSANASYRVQYRMAGLSFWFGPIAVDETQFLLEGLTVNTNYEMRVFSYCDGDESEQAPQISFFTAPDCSVPEGLIATSVTINSATIQWNGDEDASSYRIEYRELGATSWSNISYGLNSYTINGLQQEKLYEVRVRAYCGATAYSDFCPTIVLQTAAPCFPPSNLQITELTHSSATLTWNGNTSSAQTYQLQYKRKGVVPWDTLTVLGTSATLWGLDPCTEYLCRINVDCGYTESSNSPNSEFLTAQPSGYCCALAQTSSYLWIRKVTFGGIINESGNNGGYADFSASTANVQRGMQYPFQFRLGLTKKSNTRYWDVWIDYDHDQIFDPEEHAYSSGTGGLGGDISLQTGNINIPWSAALGTTKMRIALRASEHAQSCGAYLSGEVEDYTISIGEGKTEAQNSPAQWQLFPNPAQNYITLYNEQPYDGNLSHEQTIYIYNQQGQLVLSDKLMGSSAVLDIEQLPTGMYYLHLVSHATTFTAKWLKIAD